MKRALYILAGAIALVIAACAVVAGERALAFFFGEMGLVVFILVLIGVGGDEKFNKDHRL